MQFASDVMEGDFILRMIGKQQIWLENYRSILEYTEEQIVVIGKQVRIQIQGTKLRIEYYGAVEMKISGNIETIRFV